MLFLEEQARFWLVVHAVVGAATVAVTTHLVVWIRRYPRGEFGRHRAARWFATAALLLYGGQFALGNLLYPSYKVRVRAEYFDLPAAAREERRVRDQARAAVDERARVTPLPAPPAAGRDLPALGRLFDVKEHWAALGLGVALALGLVAWAWDPRRDGDGATALFVSLAVACAGCAWLAALVGLFVSSHRAVGSP